MAISGIAISLAISTVVFTVPAYSAIDVYQFDNEQQEQQYRALIDEFRCPKCQNQNLASSDSVISQDLKKKTYQLVKSGKSDDEIRDYMLERYGDFITYNPPVRPSTYLLWYFPPVLLLFAIGFWLYKTANRQNYRQNDRQKRQSQLSPTQPPPKGEELPERTLSKQNTNKSSTNKPATNNQFILKTQVVLLLLAVALTTLLYFTLDNRSTIVTFWKESAKVEQVADDLLTGKIDSPPDWAIKTVKDRQILITAMQANVHRHTSRSTSKAIKATNTSNASDASNISDASRWMKLAELFLSMQATDEALQAMERANRLEPNNAKIATTYAKTSYFANGERMNKKARRVLQNLLATHPNHRGALMLMIMGETRAGNHDKALLWVDRLRRSIINNHANNHNANSKDDRNKALANLDRLTQSIKNNQRQAKQNAMEEQKFPNGTD